MSRLCARHGVTRAGYYAWRSRRESAHRGTDRVLAEEIGVIFDGSGTYESAGAACAGGAWILGELETRGALDAHGWAAAACGADLPVQSRAAPLQ